MCLRGESPRESGNLSPAAPCSLCSRITEGRKLHSKTTRPSSGYLCLPRTHVADSRTLQATNATARDWNGKVLGCGAQPPSGCRVCRQGPRSSPKEPSTGSAPGSSPSSGASRASVRGPAVLSSVNPCPIPGPAPESPRGVLSGRGGHSRPHGRSLQAPDLERTLPFRPAVLRRLLPTAPRRQDLSSFVSWWFVVKCLPTALLGGGLCPWHTPPKQ